MIVSASRRTDIPAYYSRWMQQRIKDGFALVRNPYNPKQMTRVELTPDTVDCIVFWTKDPLPMLPLLKNLDHIGWRFYLQFTLNPYAAPLEPMLRPLHQRIETFHALSRMLGKERVLWRYDPIICNTSVDTKQHEVWFDSLCRQLQGATEQVTISFVDLYAKQKSPLIRSVYPQEVQSLSRFFGAAAKARGMTVRSCCEGYDLHHLGIEHGKCIDRDRIERLWKINVQSPKDPGQRTNCGCCKSTDIGAYDTCPGGCMYCYANHSEKRLAANRFSHNPHSPLLTGNVTSTQAETVKIASETTGIQTRLF